MTGAPKYCYKLLLMMNHSTWFKRVNQLKNHMLKKPIPDGYTSLVEVPANIKNYTTRLRETNKHNIHLGTRFYQHTCTDGV
jgi:hypothetical protein